MKQLLPILLFCLSGICFSQSKEKLLKEIEKANIVESDCVGSYCQEGEQYLNFKKLKKLLSAKELLGLTRSENPVLRSYAFREIIQNTNKNDSVIDFLAFELDKNQTVLIFEGCTQGLELVSSLVYHEYWNKIRIEALESIKTDDEVKRNEAMQKRLASDEVMEKMDSIIVHSDKNVYWLLYLRAFENRKHKDSYVPRIEKLAFEQNNVYALYYLNQYYPTQSMQKIKSYFENEFQKVTFKEEEDSQYFVELIEFLINSNDVRFHEIALEKLRKDKDVWENNSYRIDAILEKKGIKL